MRLAGGAMPRPTGSGGEAAQPVTVRRGGSLRSSRRVRVAPGASVRRGPCRLLAAQILTCELFIVDTVWLTRLYVLLFIEVGSRRVHLACCTAQPTAAWMAQRARYVAWKLQDGGLKVKFLLRDRDTKFSNAFDEIFRSEGLRVSMQDPAE